MGVFEQFINPDFCMSAFYNASSTIITTFPALYFTKIQNLRFKPRFPLKTNHLDFKKWPKSQNLL